MVQNLANKTSQYLCDPIFLVYNINLNTHDQEYCTQRLEALGFHKVSVGVRSNVEFWSSHTCVLMIKRDIGKPTGVDGIAFSTTDRTPGYQCSVTGFRKTHDPRGFDVYTVLRTEMPTVIGEYFQVHGAMAKNYAWRKFAGMCFGHCDDRTIDFYVNRMHFNHVETTQHHDVLVSNNNQFYLYFAKHSNPDPMIMITTNDIFDVTAKLETNNIESAKLNLHEQNKKYIEKINNENLQYHRIAAWDLAVHGRGNRYVIDNFFPQALPNLDIVATSRVNCNSISEHNLCVFENLREQHV